MRQISFIVAVAALLAVPSVAGSPQTGLPGLGTFTYSGSPVATPPATIVVAGLTRADRS